MEADNVLAKPHIFSLSIEEADLLLGCGGDAALVFLYILRSGGHFAREKAEKTLSLTGSMQDALDALTNVGLISLPAPKPKPAPVLLERPDTPPEYTIADIKQQIDAGGRFKSLLDEAERCLGRVLSTSDMTVLFGIYDYVGLPPEVILLMINWCIHDYEQRYGTGSRPTLRQIEKVSYIWARDGIYSLELAEKYVMKQTEKRQLSYEIKKRLGIKERALSPSEEKYILSWLEMGFGTDAITEAYDRTVLKVGELKWPYMNRILESWKKKNLVSLDDILNGDPRERQQTRIDRTESEGTKPEISEFERMQKYINKLNGGGSDGA